MKILVVSDIESKYIWDHFDPERFRDVKLIISCGDLSASYLSFLVTMIPCPLLYVPGNHDAAYSVRPPEGCINIDGRFLEYKGVRILGLGGCKSPRSRPLEFSDMQMWRKVQKMEPYLRRSRGLDLLVTHAPAIGLGDEPNSFHEGFEAFRYLDDLYKPAIHFYGHRHLGENPMDRRAIYPYLDTVMVNACGYKIIEYDKGVPMMAPPGAPPCEMRPTPMPPRRFSQFFRR